jgi:ferredoxin
MAAWAEGAELHCDLEPLIQQLQSLVEKQKDYAGRAGTCTRCFKPIQNCPHRDISIAPDPEGAKKVWEGFEW